MSQVPIAPREKIAILGWGSLLSDDPEQSVGWHGSWFRDGPSLKIEFSRVSQTAPRRGVLTLVIDPENGSTNRVAYCYSARNNVDEAVDDLARRERMPSTRNIGCFVRTKRFEQSHDGASLEAIRNWAIEKNVDAVIWTDLRSNFTLQSGLKFSVAAAMDHLKGLDAAARGNAIDYIRGAPDFVRTPLREAVEEAPPV